MRLTSRLAAREPAADHTAAVPELAVSLKGRTGKLWIRWYKLASDANNQEWIAELSQRHPPPLAAAMLRAVPEDFVVEEQMPFILAGTGEHLW